MPSCNGQGKGLDLREGTLGEMLFEEQLFPIAARLFARRDMTEDMLRKELERITGIFGSVQEVDEDQLTRDANRLLWLGPDVSVSGQIMVVMQQVGGFLHENE